MAARVELVEMCKELDIETEGLTIKEMEVEIRAAADKRFISKFKISADYISGTLRKFLTEEYDFVILDKEEKELDYKLRRKDAGSES